MDQEHVKPDASVIEIRRRVYRGKFAAPKNGLVRTIAIPPSTAALLRDWMEKAVDQNPETYVFAGETGQPLWRSSLLEDHIRAKLEPIGLGWVNFQVMRRTAFKPRPSRQSGSEGVSRPARAWHWSSSRCLHQVEYGGSGDRREAA